MFDGKAFGAEIVALVREYVADKIAPLTAEIDAIDNALTDHLLQPVPAAVPGERGPAGEPGPQGPAGKDGVSPQPSAVAIDELMISQQLADDVAKAIAKLAEAPPLQGKNGTGNPVINLHIAERGSPPKKKLISTRRDDAGNLVADVIEQDA